MEPTAKYPRRKRIEILEEQVNIRQKQIPKKRREEAAKNVPETNCEISQYEQIPFEGRPLIFVSEYLRTRNAVEAARRAGYKGVNAVAAAKYWIKHPAINQYIKQQELKLMQEAEIQAKDIVNTFIQIATANIEDYLNPDGTMKDLTECPNTAAIQEIMTIKDETAKGTTTKVKIKMYNKLDALQNLGKYLGLYEKDNRQRPQAVTLNLDSLNIDQLQAIVTASPEQLQRAMTGDAAGTIEIT